MPPEDAGAPPASPRFLLDQNVQEAVRQFLIEQGYETLRTRDLSGAAAPDTLIAFIANVQGLVLVTHDSDFRRIDRLLHGEQRRRFQRVRDKFSYRRARTDHSNEFRPSGEAFSSIMTTPKQRAFDFSLS